MRALGFLVGLLAVSTIGEAAEGRLKLTVSVPTFSYAPDEHMFKDGTLRITATLTNTGALPVYVSKSPLESICPTTMIRDGIPVPSSTSSVDYIDAPIPRDRLVLLKPGESLARAIRVLHCAPHGDLYKRLHYAESLPGRYSVKLMYRYEGLDWDHAPVFRGAVESNAIEFEIRAPGK